MSRPTPPQILPSDITTPELFFDRRHLLKLGVAGAAFGTGGVSRLGRQ